MDRFVFVYLDDILIFSKSPAEHVAHVRQVLQRLLENKLYVKAEKCEFHQQSVPFLGYIIERGQVKADPEKIKAVTAWPTPSTRKQLQRFLGFAIFFTDNSLRISVESHPPKCPSCGPLRQSRLCVC